jgi:heptosyltransferase I
MLPLTAPPETVCLLRLSAIGDTCHVVPLLRTLQAAWPATRFTWVIGRTEARLMSLIPEVEFITVDKRAGWRGLRELRRQCRGRSFDVLLHLQLALRASLCAAVIPARIKLGFDRARAKELQWLFTNAQIAPRQDEHVLDSLLGFARALGVPPQAPQWNLRLPPDALQYAKQWIPDHAAPTLLISACSSHPRRNWRAEHYATVARYAQQRHGLRVILVGSPSALERDMAAAIRRECPAAIDTVGQDTLPQLLALLARARALLTPDSGPAHMASMVDTPVLGLYAATRSARSGPYLSRPWCVDVYADAAQRYRQCAADALSWGHKIEEPGVMDLITPDQVCERLDALLASS